MDDVTWDDRVAAGTLIDFTELTSKAGFLWPVGVTEDLERWVQRTLPPRIGVPETLDRKRLEVLDVAMTAAIMGVVIEGGKRLIEYGTTNPSATSFVFRYEASWKEGETQQIRMSVVEGPNGVGQAFVVSLASE